ncbi:hypothetical protein BUE80_DR012060 [Diplocarpon rosae]|nr:hypothetical protein BUE80_DR012060 [Diplocarpon rosae]
MSTTTPAAPSPATTSREALIHNLSLGALIVCPIIILIPPRKLDIYTVFLTAGFFAGGNELAREYTGKSIASRFGSRVTSIVGQDLPPKALETQRLLREEKAARAKAAGREDPGQEAEGISKVMEAVWRKEAANRTEVESKAKEEEKGLLRKVWYGAEGPDWKAKRDKREKEALEQGRGYGGLIVDQIYEVWGWGKGKAEEVKEIDEKVVKKEQEQDGKK